MLAMEVTHMVFQSDRLRLKALALWNILSMEVTLAVFQLDTSPSKEIA